MGNGTEAALHAASPQPHAFKKHPISFLRPNPAGLMPIADHEKNVLR